MNRRYLLAADFGGTKTLVALAVAGKPWPDIIARREYVNREYESPERIVADFVAGNAAVAPIGAACFAVAGPVAGNRCVLTNIDWTLDGATLARTFDLPAVSVINDFAAAGLGLARLGDDDIVTLQPGVPVEHGTRLVLGAGTGLGVCVLTWAEEGFVAHASEAGHADFAPVDELQDRLLVHLRRTCGWVSYECVVSGPGLTRIAGFLREANAGTPSQRVAQDASRDATSADAISELAASGRDPLAVQALDLFVAVYGAFAGSLALATLPMGGVYVAGGIAPRIIAKLRDGTFMRAFVNKEPRYRELLRTIPVRVVTNPQLGLLGALLEAQRMINPER